jgi:hypothetical protein
MDYILLTEYIICACVICFIILLQLLDLHFNEMLLKAMRVKKISNISLFPLHYHVHLVTD